MNSEIIATANFEREAKKLRGLIENLQDEPEDEEGDEW